MVGFLFGSGYGQYDIRHKGRYNTNLRVYVPEGRQGPGLFG